MFINVEEDRKKVYLFERFKSLFKKKNTSNPIKDCDTIELKLYFEKNIIDYVNSNILEEFNCKDLVKYQGNNQGNMKKLFGIKIGNYVHEYMDYNSFKKSKTLIPNNYKRVRLTNKNKYCGIKKKLKIIYPDNLIIKFLKSKKFLKFINLAIYDIKTYLNEYNIPFNINIKQNDIKSIKKIKKLFEIKIHINLIKDKKYIKNNSKKQIYLQNLIYHIYEILLHMIMSGGIIWETIPNTQKNKYLYTDLRLNKLKSKIINNNSKNKNNNSKNKNNNSKNKKLIV